MRCLRRRCLFSSALKITISIWGSVDIADQLHSYYDTQLTSFRTWWPMLFWAYDTMITNAYIIFKDMPQSPDAITHKEFCLQYTWDLILVGAGQVSTSQSSQSTKLKSVKPNVKEGTSLPLGRSCDCGNFPTHLDGGRRLGYWPCHWKERENPTKDTKLLPKTRWTCSKCEIPLCLNDERNCFTEFHQL